MCCKADRRAILKVRTWGQLSRAKARGLHFTTRESDPLHFKPVDGPDDPDKNLRLYI
jgi:hypothetical protein